MGNYITSSIMAMQSSIDEVMNLLAAAAW